MTYEDVCDLLATEHVLFPVGFLTAPGELTIFVPDWADAHKYELEGRWAQHFPTFTVYVEYVIDVPHNALFGEWRAHAPRAQEEV